MSILKGKRLLVIGAGHGQLPLIEKAIEMGIYVVAVDVNPEACGMKVASESYPIDIVDKEAILELALKKSIDGVVTMQSDLPVPAVGYVNEKMSLSGVDYEAAVICSNKNNTRERFFDSGVLQPKYFVCETFEEVYSAVEKLGFPSVVKSADSSGSRGIVKVESSDVLQDAYDEAIKFSRSGKIVVEEFIEGVEIGAQTFSVNGKCVVVCLHNDFISSKPYMIPIGHSYPLNIEGLDRQFIESEVAKAVIALGVNDGPANVDLIIGNNGRPYIIEIGARIGATCLPELTSQHLGIDWVYCTIQSAIGIAPDFNTLKSDPCAAFILESPNDGVLKEVIIPGDLKSNDNLLELEVTVSPGDEVSILRKGTDRIGKVFCKGKNVADAEKISQEVRDKIEFVVA